MVSEKQLELCEYKVLGQLPNPFLFKNGETVRTISDWARRRKELYESAVEIQFGTMPPSPERVDVELLFNGKTQQSYRITAWEQNKYISFLMKLIIPQKVTFPVIINGDLCSNYYLQPGFIDAAVSEGIGWVFFDRTELAHDVMGEGRRQGSLYNLYPGYSFGAIGAWAWGYSRCIDALEQICTPEIDLEWTTASGHSRGGKAAILAGAVDERIKIVNPNQACLGGGGCYRIHSQGDYPGLDRWPSETLRDICKDTGFWFGPDLEKYIGCEEKMPFDAHYLKAMIAPRILLVSEAAGDMWANPVGAWQTTIAAQEVFQFLDVPENLFWYFREGTHYHKVSDIRMLVNVINHCRNGTKLEDGFYNRPFKAYKKIYDWTVPIKSDASQRGEET